MMPPFPLLHLSQLIGPVGAALVFGLIGVAFGATLEMAGFGISTHLAAQFYFRDLRVLKVMLTAIVVAMLLIFATSGLGLLDFNQVWVNTTYLWPGIVGGLLMGAGFVIGGFCPGTSLVAAVTGKIDGLLFALGAMTGVFVFGETVSLFDEFWNSSNLGRLTLMDVTGLPAGVLVVAIVLLAVVAFWGAEQLERMVTKEGRKPAPRWRYGLAGLAVITALGVLAIGQPTAAERWAWVATEAETMLNQRWVQIHPGELLALMHDEQIHVILLDVRDRADFDAFHLPGARHVPPTELRSTMRMLYDVPPNTLIVTVGNGEGAATDAWRSLRAEGIPNIYILEGGINGWLDTFATDDFKRQYVIAPDADDSPRYALPADAGLLESLADPDPDAYDLTYSHKVNLLALGVRREGGCG